MFKNGVVHKSQKFQNIKKKKNDMKSMTFQQIPISDMEQYGNVKTSIQKRISNKTINHMRTVKKKKTLGLLKAWDLTNAPLFSQARNVFLCISFEYSTVGLFGIQIRPVPSTVPSPVEIRFTSNTQSPSKKFLRNKHIILCTIYSITALS